MPEPGHIDLGDSDQALGSEYRALTPDELAERWRDDEPLSTRPIDRSLYKACDGTTMELVHPQMVPPPSIMMHDGVPARPIEFHYQGPA